MSGYVYISEYSNMGDVATETPVEPCIRVQKVAVGDCSEPINSEARMVLLFATFPCRISFSSVEHDPVQAWPLASGVETARLVRPNTGMSVHVYPEEMMM